MTIEEAIKILKAIRVYECYPKSASEETKEALDMAIEALSEPINENREIIKDILKMMPTAYLLEALGVATFDELMERGDEG